MTDPNAPAYNEPWTEYAGGVYVKGMMVIRPSGVCEYKDQDRIVACVNAMAGISDPAAFVKAHNELVEAATVTARHCQKCCGTRNVDNEQCPRCTLLWDAIAACSNEVTP